MGKCFMTHLVKKCIKEQRIVCAELYCEMFSKREHTQFSDGLPSKECNVITIRPYQKKDFRFVQDICLEMSWLHNDQTPLNRAWMCAKYCDYYLDCESEFCFVAVDDEQDAPVGYILCAGDFANYREILTENYLPIVRKLSSSDYFRFAAELKVEERYAKQGYTAHLLINVLPEYQHQGVGSQLIEALLDKLKEMFVEGVYVVCGSKNQPAKALFEKHGFDDIDYITGAVVYGKKLYSEED